MEYQNMRKEIEAKKIPPVLRGKDGKKIDTLQEWQGRRGELTDLIARECYGRMPDGSVRVEGRTVFEDRDAVGGKAFYERVWMRIRGNIPAEGLQTDSFGGMVREVFEFPVNVVVPKEMKKPPVFLNISFSPALVHAGMPLEELIDLGYAVVSFYYQDVAPDRRESWPYANASRTGSGSEWGAISKWAWAASRVMDYLKTRDDIDTERVGVAGASRLGKTALWAAVCDPRFSLAVPMVSGTGGISLYRGNEKEDIDHLIDEFPYWFCSNYEKYKGREGEIPFDAHFLAALMAPRHFYVCSADRDQYDDIRGGYLACIAANEVYELYGKKGICALDRYPQAGYK